MDHKDVMILKGMSNFNLNMFISLGESIQRPSKDSNLKMADSHNVGVILTKED